MPKRFDVEQLMHPDRTRPYVTIVDTGIAMAAQNLLAGLVLARTEGDWGDWPNPDDVERIANALAREIHERTF